MGWLPIQIMVISKARPPRECVPSQRGKREARVGSRLELSNGSQKVSEDVLHGQNSAYSAFCLRHGEPDVTGAQKDFLHQPYLADATRCNGQLHESLRPSH